VLTIVRKITATFSRFRCILLWNFVEQTETSKETALVFVLTDGSAKRKLLPYSFVARLCRSIGTHCRIGFEVHCEVVTIVVL
jgi:hypothetical protein